MGLSQYLPILAAAGAGRAKGNVNREAIEREELQQALVEHHRQRADKRADRQLELEDRRLTQSDLSRQDLLDFRRQDAATRATDRDEDRAVRKETARQASADRAEARAARTQSREYRPDEREQAADEFAFRMVSAANGDPRVAQDYGARDMATAKKLGLRRDHYYAAARRYNERLTAKSKATVTDDELEGNAPAKPAAAAPTAAPKGKSYSSDPNIRRAQEMWDASAALQQKRPRP